MLQIDTNNGNDITCFKLTQTMLMTFMLQIDTNNGNDITCYKLTQTMVMTLHVTNWHKQKISKHFYGNKSHVQIELIIKSKININKSKGNESCSQDKNSKIRTSLSPIENNKFFPLLTGEDITAVN